MKKNNYPLCECPNPGSMCCRGIGPAVYEVKRGKKKLKLCTRCDFGGDKRIRVLPWVKKAPAKLLMDFDPLGAFCLAFDLGEKPRY